MNTFLQLERKKAQEIANQYRQRGYNVILEPDELPEFLKGVRVDIVAISERDNVLIEIVSQATINDRNKLESLAKIVKGRENWRFEVVVTNPRYDVRNDISLQEIINRIDQSKNLILSEQYPAALLLAWSATEAIMRVIANRDNIDIQRLSTIQLIKSMYFVGSIGKPAYEKLLLAAKQRNQIAHGYQPEVSIKDLSTISADLIQITSDLVKKLSEEIDESEETLSVDDLVEWFFDHFEDPVHGVPYESGEGGYQYILGGPYDPWEELADQFPNVYEEIIKEAANKIYNDGYEWVKKGQY